MRRDERSGLHLHVAFGKTHKRGDARCNKCDEPRNEQQSKNRVVPRKREKIKSRIVPQNGVLYVCSYALYIPQERIPVGGAPPEPEKCGEHLCTEPEMKLLPGYPEQEHIREPPRGHGGAGRQGVSRENLFPEARALSHRIEPEHLTPEAEEPEERERRGYDDSSRRDKDAPSLLKSQGRHQNPGPDTHEP